MKKILGLIAALLLIFASCEDPANSSGGGDDEKLYVGTWYAVSGSNIYTAEIKSDGTFSYYESEEDEWTTGTYRVVDSTITLINDGETNEGVYTLTVTDETMSFSLVSDSDTERSNIALLSWSKTNPNAVYTVSGTVTVPDEAAGKHYAATLVNDSESIYLKDQGTVSGTTLSFSISDVKANDFQFLLVVDMDGSWGGDAGINWDVMTEGDYYAMKADLPVNQDLALSGLTLAEYDDELVDGDLVGSWYRAVDCELFVLSIYGDGTAACTVYQDTEEERVNYESDGSEITIWEDGDSEADYGTYAYALSDGELIFTLNSDSDTDRSAVVAGTWTSVMPAVYEVSGTIALPSDATGKKYYVGIDSNDDGGDGMNYITGTVSGSTIDYSVGGIPAGTYFMHLVVDVDDSWGDEEAGPVANGDYWAFYGMTGGNPPESATLVIDGDRTVDLTAVTFVSETGEGTNTVSGTITLPVSVSEKTYYICLDTNLNGDDGMEGFLSEQVTGTSINYSFSNVSDGTYYLYAIVDMDGSGEGISSGDYWMFNGMVNSNPSTAESIDVAGDVSVDMTLEAYTG